jgi:Fe-S oxidoreductase
MTKEELLEKALCCNRCGSCRGVSQDTVPDQAFSTQCLSGMTLLGAHEPAGLMYIARGLALGSLKWDKDIAATLYTCTLCGYCEDLCSRGYRHTPAISILEELRRIIPEDLKPKNMQKAAKSIAVKTHSLNTLKAYGLTDLCEGGRTDTIFFPDNSVIANGSKLKEIGFLMQKSGKKIGYFGKNPLPPVDTTLLNGGYSEVVEESMEEIDARIETHGVKRIICYNPESLSLLKRFSNSRAEFISITRFYAEMIKKKPHKNLKLPAVTYQDPCHLGRYAKEYTAPRQVIAGLGLTLKEMWRSGRNALCCGAGGGVLSDNPKLAKRYAASRWQEARATGAKVMITACQLCNANLRQGTPKDFKVIDITSLMAQSYGYKGKVVR